MNLVGRQRILRHLRGEPVDRLPVMPITMMFAADQIGARYRDYASDHRVLVEAQLTTSARFDFDYVSVISDPAREAAALGAEIEWFENQPPAFREGRALLAEKNGLKRLKVPDPLDEGRMRDRVLGVELLSREVQGEKLVEGWIEGPCAQAANLRGINTLMLDFYDDPGFVRDLFEFVVDMELGFARCQVSAGAELMGIGDAAASLVGPRLYEEFVFPFETKLIQAVRQLGALVRLHICGRTRRILPWICRSGAEILDLDWMVPLDEARRLGGADLVLLGNLDPVEVVRNGTPERIDLALATCHRQAGERYIVGAGCEIVRDTPSENLRSLVRYAQTHRPSDHENL